ncbi:IclR family transcriptional regulator [Streptomyces sp. NPDC085932]|uniref:IclR family transcriptional regulator n=1 Tax=Streptomyces sp. NPDC085932 TaxID=3365741 RepID=UPI0037D404F7
MPRHGACDSQRPNRTFRLLGRFATSAFTCTGTSARGRGARAVTVSRGAGHVNAPDPARRCVKSLARGLEVLGMLRQASTPVRQSDIARAVQLPLPTVHRLIGTLETYGYVTRCIDGRHFQVHPDCRLPDDSDEPRPMLERELATLSYQVGEWVGLGLLTGRRIKYVCSASEDVPGTGGLAGLPSWAHCSALGQSLLAQRDDASVLARLGSGPYERLTAHTPTSWPQLREPLARARRTGCARSKDEFQVGVTGLSVALTAYGDVWPLAIEVLMPNTRAKPERMRVVAQLLRAASGRIGAIVALSPGILTGPGGDADQ